MTKKAKVLWVDMEMGGLNPRADVILEVAAIATDWDFNELAVYEGVVHQSEETLSTMNQWCIDQHGSTGLTQRSRESDLSLEAVENMMIKFIDENFKDGDPILLGGNSIHQDRQFINFWWPKLADRLHYRMLDVSAWKVVFDGKYGKRFAKPEDHRALEDIRGSIMELKYYLGKIKP